MPTFAFADTMAAISGPNGNFSFGAGSGNTEGGITVAFVEDKSTMTIGADGVGMHSLHSGEGAIITVRLLKTSPTNAQFSNMYKLDTAGGATHGKSTISIKDLARGDDITCQECAFAKFPDITYAKEGGECIWSFHSAKTNIDLGDGLAVAA